MQKKCKVAAAIIIICVIASFFFIGKAVIDSREEIYLYSIDEFADLAKSGARQAVKELLIAPSTAEFLQVTIIDRNRDYYMVRAIFNSHDISGQRVMSDFMVIVQVKNAQVQYSNYSSAVSYDPSPTGQERFKRLNGWPEE